MKFDGRTQTPTSKKISQLRLKIFKLLIAKQKKEQEFFWERVQRKLEQLEQDMSMPRNPIEDTNMESVRTTSPVDTPEVSSAFDDEHKLMRAFNRVSVT